jgi:serine/threonine protein kinase
VVHRDLKPDNLMFKDVDTLEGLTIVDFGLATSLYKKELIIIVFKASLC